MQKKKIASDVIWSVAALVLMNGVLQVFVYPMLNRQIGEDGFGNVLFVMGIVAIFAPAIGLSVNNTRLIRRRTEMVENGDCLLALLIQLLPAFALTCLILQGYFPTVRGLITACVLVGITTLRYYGDVQYRMTLNYKGMFLYYSAISAGYLIGVLIYPISESWLLTFLIGEVLCNVFLLITGNVYRPIRLSPTWKSFLHHSITLTGSYVVYNAVLNLDRVLLKGLIGSSAVTVFYVASLLGKTLALLVGPLNGVVIGYLTKSSNLISRRSYALMCAAMCAVGAMLYGAVSLVTPWFARTFYADIADEVIALAPVANLSQIVCFSASIMLTVMLTFCSDRWQLFIQGSYGILFILFGVIGTKTFGVNGFVFGCLAANLLRLFGTACAGIILSGKRSSS